MKRRVAKISLVVIVVVGIVLSLLVVLTWDWGPGTSFGFLDGRALTACLETGPGTAIYSETRYIYSFEADFKDVCTEVGAELSKLGFQRKMRGNIADDHIHEYRLGNYGSDDLVKIGVFNRQKLITHSTLESLEHSDPARYGYSFLDGWVTIEISQARLRSWPPQYFLIRLQMMLQGAASKQPPKNL